GTELDVPEPPSHFAIPRPDAVFAAGHEERSSAPAAEEHRRAVQVQVPVVVRMNLVGPPQGPGRGVEGDHARAVLEVPRENVKGVPGHDVERSGAEVERRRADEGAARDAGGNGEERPQRPSRGGIQSAGPPQEPPTPRSPTTAGVPVIPQSASKSQRKASRATWAGRSLDSPALWRVCAGPQPCAGQSSRARAGARRESKTAPATTADEARKRRRESMGGPSPTTRVQ